MNKLIISAIALALVGVPAYLITKNTNKIEAKAELRNRKSEDVPVFDIGSTIRINSPKDVQAKRDAIIKMVWGSFPTGFPNLTRIGDTLTVKQPYGIDSVVSYQEKGKECLAIWHNGHVNKGHGLESPSFFEGCDTLTFHMPLMDTNPQPFVSTKDGVFHMTSHDAMAILDNPMYYFLNPVAEALNYAFSRHSYKKVYMAGLSGGGWTTTVYAAIDPRITVSIPIAGSTPQFLKTVTPVESFGDFEQNYRPLLDLANYQEMYVMATDKGRKQVQMLNRLDDCCHYGEASKIYVYAVSEKAKQVGGTWEQYMDMGSRHHEVTHNMERHIKSLMD